MREKTVEREQKVRFDLRSEKIIKKTMEKARIFIYQEKMLIMF